MIPNYYIWQFSFKFIVSWQEYLWTMYFRRNQNKVLWGILYFYNLEEDLKTIFKDEVNTEKHWGNSADSYVHMLF